MAGDASAARRWSPGPSGGVGPGGRTDRSGALRPAAQPDSAHRRATFWFTLPSA